MLQAGSVASIECRSRVGQPSDHISEFVKRRSKGRSGARVHPEGSARCLIVGCGPAGLGEIRRSDHHRPGWRMGGFNRRLSTTTRWEPDIDSPQRPHMNAGHRDFHLCPFDRGGSPTLRQVGPYL